MSIRCLKKFAAAAVASLVVCLLALSSVSSAQGFSGLSQLLGGGGFGRGRNSSQATTNATAVTVERGAAPYTGRFTGKQTTNSGTDAVSTQFACYPAHDPDFAQTKAFLCYAAQ